MSNNQETPEIEQPGTAEDEQSVVETPDTTSAEAKAIDDSSAAEVISQSLLTGTLGYVNFDSGASDSTTTGAMVSPEFRRRFRRDSYVLITDSEQSLEFLGRVVEGPFHTPHV